LAVYIVPKTWRARSLVEIELEYNLKLPKQLGVIYSNTYPQQRRGSRAISFASSSWAGSSPYLWPPNSSGLCHFLHVAPDDKDVFDLDLVVFYLGSNPLVLQYYLGKLRGESVLLTMDTLEHIHLPDNSHSNVILLHEALKPDEVLLLDIFPTSSGITIPFN
jgi:hypothetical protein